jgi:hypothetical protein
MPEVAEKQKESAPVAKRTKRAGTFHVFRLVGDHWVHLTKTAVIASSRKEAIRKATGSLEEKAGTFLAVVEREFKPLTRKVEQRTEDIFE